jgi:cell division septation protein DedD
VCNLKTNPGRILLAICLVSLVFSLPSCNYIKQKLHLGKYSPQEATEQAGHDSLRVADSLKRVAAEKEVSGKRIPDSVKKVLDEKKDFNTTMTDSLMSIVAADPHERDSGTHYYIIIGSFSNHENAKEASDEFSKKGYKPAILTKTNKDKASLELVSIKTFTDYNQAVSFVKVLKAKSVPDAYIYTGK